MADTILFESILTDADCHATEPGAHPGWILKFENGAIIRADPAGHSEKTRKEEVWWVGRKYRVKMQHVGIVGGSKKGTDSGQGGVGGGREYCDAGRDIEFRLFFGQPATMAFIVQAREAQGAQEMSVLRSVLQTRSPGRPVAEGLPEGDLPEGP